MPVSWTDRAHWSARQYTQPRTTRFDPSPHVSGSATLRGDRVRLFRRRAQPCGPLRQTLTQPVSLKAKGTKLADYVVTYDSSVSILRRVEAMGEDRLVNRDARRKSPGISMAVRLVCCLLMLGTRATSVTRPRRWSAIRFAHVTGTRAHTVRARVALGLCWHRSTIHWVCTHPRRR